MNSSLTALILAGGLGTRLKSVTGDAPKCMTPVLKKPFLEWLIQQLKNLGIQDLVIATGYQGKVIQNHFGDGSEFGVKVKYAHEEKLLGTAGAIKNSLSHISSDPFLVLNGDSYIDFSLKTFLEFHRQKNAQISIWLSPAPPENRFGSVTIDQDGQVLKFAEKDPKSQSQWVNSGVYLISKKIISDLPQNQVISLEKEVFPRYQKHGLFAYPGKQSFIDIGTPESYSRASSFFESLNQDQDGSVEG